MATQKKLEAILSEISTVTSFWDLEKFKCAVLGFQPGSPSPSLCLAISEIYSELSNCDVNRILDAIKVQKNLSAQVEANIHANNAKFLEIWYANG